ncbi:MAG: serine/threonine protein kinase, partial [Planctomycetes bacterium]|nr:serine/threonine protein kinase [Planctomycetota bacterium]
MNLGPYTLLGELGRGGTGVVYHARDPAGREVAVKLLARKSPDALERFQREARLHQQLGLQAGFVPFLDMGLAPTGPYLVMPLLPGGTLSDQIKRRRFSPEETAELGFRLATALGRAHGLGIVHRDVKPDNVLFTQEGIPLLADLGMAKHFRHDVSGASQSVALSKDGQARGTVSYMAPEQLQDAANVGPPADVFALGALLYECLTGEPALVGATTIDLMVHVASAEHIPIRQLRADCPKWLGTLVERTLAADPDERPENGTALADALAAGPPEAAAGRPRLAA